MLIVIGSLVCPHVFKKRVIIDTSAMVGFWRALLGFVICPEEIIADQPRKDVCQENREEFGWALIGHDYKCLTAANFGRCFFECSLDEKCQSTTCLWNVRECKLKKEAKRSRLGGKSSCHLYGKSLPRYFLTLSL